MRWWVATCVAILAVGVHVRAAETAFDELARAVAAMRKIDPASLSEAQQEQKSKELNAAWKTLAAAGQRGADALKQEIAKIDAAKEKDDLFKLGAAAVLWDIGKAAEAETIAALWSGDVSLPANYNYVFFTAFAAARTQDPRVLPMLKAILRDQKGEAYIVQHSMPVRWPLSHVFAWGAFGSKGVPALVRILDESKDETTIASAIALLSTSQDLQACDKIRAIAQNGSGAARIQAIKALGVFGQPQDFDWLLAGLNEKSPADVWAFAYALYEYGDLRAVPKLIPLLSAEDRQVAQEAMACLTYLVTAEGIEALHTCSQSGPDAQRRAAAGRALEEILNPLEIKYSDFAAKAPEEKARLTAAVRGGREFQYRSLPDDRKLTHDELLKAAAEWKAQGRITGGSYAWVQDRHVLAAATAEDIPLLLDVAAACYGRLSDECLYEVRTLQQIIQRLGRARYRAEVGVCEKVVAVRLR